MHINELNATKRILDRFRQSVKSLRDAIGSGDYSEAERQRMIALADEYDQDLAEARLEIEQAEHTERQLVDTLEHQE